jgi:peptidoglycan/xylan/chitin deacetylase (PgdA/CDA1 family)
VVRRIDTAKPYVFITIDDGAVRDPQALQLIKQSCARPTLFLNDRYVQGHEDYFKQLQDQDDLVIGNHTVNHPNLAKMSYAAQNKEICDNSDAFAKAFGRRPTLFRPRLRAGTMFVNQLPLIDPRRRGAGRHVRLGAVSWARTRSMRSPRPSRRSSTSRE